MLNLIEGRSLVRYRRSMRSLEYMFVEACKPRDGWQMISYSVCDGLDDLAFEDEIMIGVDRGDKLHIYYNRSSYHNFSTRRLQMLQNVHDL